MLPQSSEFDASFQGKDNGEKPVKYLCLLDTRSQLLLRKQDSNKTCSHHISQISYDKKETKAYKLHVKIWRGY